MKNYKRLLVTGGAGFIGSEFVRYWVQKYPDCSVTVLDALTYAGNLANLEILRTFPNFHFQKGNICDSRLVEELASQEVDLIVHFAAESHVDKSLINPNVFAQTNVIGTINLLNAARKHGIRFHHISTDEVFGSLNLGSKEKFSETTRYDPRSPYSASKAASDHMVRAWHESFGVETTITNCSNNYGPYHHPEKLFPLAITNLILGYKIPIYGNGSQVRDWLYVEDHIRAIELVLLQGSIGETYCIGGLTQDISNLEIAKLIAAQFNMGNEALQQVNDRPGHDERYAVNWSKIHRDLGWSPKYTLEEGIAETITWYRNNTKWWQTIRDTVKFQKYFLKQYPSL